MAAEEAATTASHVGTSPYATVRPLARQRNTATLTATRAAATRTAIARFLTLGNASEEIPRPSTMTHDDVERRHHAVHAIDQAARSAAETVLFDSAGPDRHTRMLARRVGKPVPTSTVRPELPRYLIAHSRDRLTAVTDACSLASSAGHVIKIGAWDSCHRSAVPQFIREYLQFPPFGPKHLTNSLHHLAELAAPPSRPTPSSPSAHTAPGHSTTPD